MSAPMGGGLTYCLRYSSLPRSLGDNFFCIRFHPLSAFFRLIVVSCFLFSSPFRMNAAQFFGAARIGDVLHVIYLVVFLGVLLSIQIKQEGSQ